MLWGVGGGGGAFHDQSLRKNVAGPGANPRPPDHQSDARPTNIKDILNSQKRFVKN